MNSSVERRKDIGLAARRVIELFTLYGRDSAEVQKVGEHYRPFLEGLANEVVPFPEVRRFWPSEVNGALSTYPELLGACGRLNLLLRGIESPEEYIRNLDAVVAKHNAADNAHVRKDGGDKK